MPLLPYLPLVTPTSLEDLCLMGSKQCQSGIRHKLNSRILQRIDKAQPWRSRSPSPPRSRSPVPHPSLPPPNATPQFRFLPQNRNAVHSVTLQPTQQVVPFTQDAYVELLLAIKQPTPSKSLRAQMLLDQLMTELQACRQQLQQEQLDKRKLQIKFSQLSASADTYKSSDQSNNPVCANCNQSKDITVQLKKKVSTLEEQRVELVGQVEALQHENQKASEHSKSIQQLVQSHKRNLTCEVEALRQQLQDFRSQYGALEKERDSMWDQLEFARRETGQKQAQLCDVQRQLQQVEANNKVISAELRVNSKQGKLEGMEKELEEALKTVAELRGERNAILSALQNNEQQFHCLEKQYQIIKQENEKLSNEMQQYVVNFEKASFEMRKSQDENGQLSKALQDMQLKMRQVSVQGAIENSDSALSNNGNKSLVVQNLQKQLSELCSYVSEVQGRLQASEGCQSKLQEIEHDHEILGAKFEQTNTQLMEQYRQRDTLYQQNQDLLQVLDQKDMALCQLQGEFSKLQSQLENASIEHQKAAKISEKLQETQKELDQLIASLHQKDAENQNLELKFKELQEQYKQCQFEKNELSCLFEQSSEAAQSSFNKNELLQQQISKAMEELKQKKDTAEQCQLKIEQLQHSTQEYQKQNGNLKVEKELLSENYDKCKNELLDLHNLNNQLEMQLTTINLRYEQQCQQLLCIEKESHSYKNKMDARNQLLDEVWCLVRQGIQQTSTEKQDEEQNLSLDKMICDWSDANKQKGLLEKLASLIDLITYQRKELQIISTLNKRIADVQAELDSSQKELQASKLEAEGQQYELCYHKKTSGEYESQLREAKQELSSVQKDLTLRCNQYNQLQKELDMMTAAKDSWKVTSSKLDEQLKEKVVELNEKEKFSHEQQNKIRNLQVELEQLKSSIQKMQNELQNCEAQNRVYQVDLETTQKEATTSKEQFSSLQQQLVQTNNQLNLQQEACRKLESQCQDLVQREVSLGSQLYKEECLRKQAEKSLDELRAQMRCNTMHLVKTSMDLCNEQHSIHSQRYTSFSNDQAINQFNVVDDYDYQLLKIRSENDKMRQELDRIRENNSKSFPHNQCDVENEKYNMFRFPLDEDQHVSRQSPPAPGQVLYNNMLQSPSSFDAKY